MTITGTVAQVNDLLNTNATSTVSYVDNTDTPSASSTLTLTVHDNGNTGTGGDLVSVDTSTINITAVNDAPVATITPASYAATEQMALTLKNTGLSISDVDAGSGSMTVTLAVTEGTLTVTAGTSGAVVTNSGTVVGDHHRHGGADQRPAQHQRHQHGQLRRQHRYPERQLDADADRARQRQHRHRRRPGLERHLDDQHHGGERRAGICRNRLDPHSGDQRGCEWERRLHRGGSCGLLHRSRQRHHWHQYRCGGERA